MDAFEGKKGAVIVNIAPRGHKTTNLWENGTPFGYFYYKKTLIISSIESYTLSLVKKLSLTKSINLLHIPEVLNQAQKALLIKENLKNYIINSQFRSFDFLPRLTEWILNKRFQIPFSKFSIDKISNIYPCIWCIDGFGNIKTTITNKEIDFKSNQIIKTNFGEIKYYHRLKDLPINKFGIYVGSSGIENTRFLEIAKQRGNASNELKLQIGDKINLFKE